MNREVYLIIDGDETCLGTVEEVLNLAGFDGKCNSDHTPFTRRQWKTVLDFAGVLAWVIGDMVCEADGCDTKDIVLEIR